MISDNKASILVISPQFYPTIGGYEISTLRTLIKIKNEVKNIRVITEKNNKNLLSFELVKGIEVHRWWCIKMKGIHILTSLVGMLMYLIRFNMSTNIWYVPTINIFTVNVILLGKIFGKKIIVRSATTGSQGINNIFETSFQAGILNIILRLADRIIVPSQKAKDEAKKFGFKKTKLMLIPNGVDINKFYRLKDVDKTSLIQNYKLNDKKLIIFVGRLSHEKNPLGLIEAWSLIDESFLKDWKLLFIGDGPQYHELIDASNNLKYPTSVIIAGKQNNIVEWLSISEIFVQPSLREGMSNALLEAMSCELPILSTDVGGANIIKEANCGYVIPCNDKNKLTESLQDLMRENKNRQIFGANARRAIIENYSLEISSKKHLKIYEEILR